MVNKVTLIGHTGIDPEIKHLENGTMVARISLATNESYKDKNGEWQSQAEWHNIVLWRELAERAEKSLKKGMFVYVEGKISYRKYQDAEKKDRYITDIVASTFRLLEKREGGGGGNFESAKFPGEDSRYAQTTSSSNNSEANVSSTPVESSVPSGGGDDLPF
jgi:single-strand DNA-binding protein